MRALAGYARWILPDLLTTRLATLSVAQTHWVARKAGVFDGLHAWMHEYCPCGVDLDPGEVDLA